MRALCPIFLMAGCAQAGLQGAAGITLLRAEARRITNTCGLPLHTIRVDDDGSIHVRPKNTETYQRVDCALVELRNSKVIPNAPTSFIGNERYDEDVQ